VCAEFKTCDHGDLVKRVDKELAQVISATPATSNNAVRFWVTNPSKKLHLTLEVYARPGTNGAGLSPTAHDYTGETWQLYAVAKDNPDTELNPAFVDGTGTDTPRNLPDSRNVNDGVKLIHGVLSIDGENQPTGDIYKVVAIWEPVDPAMTLAERLYWFARCELSGDQARLVEVANGNA
jgi:hypothetical protein